MTDYRVVGSCEVNGVAPGGVVHDLPDGVNVAALISAGHLDEVDEAPQPAASAAAAGVASATGAASGTGETELMAGE